MKQYVRLKPQIIKEGELIHRAFVCDNIKAVDADKRHIDFVISTERSDRMGDVITVAGWDLKEYKKNPVVLFGHASRVPPIGKAFNVRKEEGVLKATAEFMSEDISPFAYSIFRMYQEGFLKAVSVGFIPHKWERMTDDEDNFVGYKFLKQELLEFSAVPIPANPDALLDAKAKGINVDPFKDFAEELLDNWKDMADPVRLLYGVDKKGVEMIRRKAVGTKSTLKVDPAVQDDLLAKNLAAAKAQKAAAAVGAEGEGGHETEAATTEKSFVQLLTESKLAELEDDVLEKMGADSESIQITTNKVGDDIEISLDDTPEKSVISLELLKAVGATSTIIKAAVKGDDFEVVVDGVNKTATYKVVGVCLEKQVAYAERTALIEKSVDEAEDVDTKDAEDTGDTAKADEKAEATEGTSEKEAADGESNEADGSTEDKGATDEQDTEEKGDEAEAEAEKSTEQMLSTLEANLCSMEELLDKSDNSDNEKGLSKREQRKLEFLAGWMRELADRISPVKATDEEKSTTSEKDEEPYVDTADLQKALGEKLGPLIEPMVKRAINKFRGRLD